MPLERELERVDDDLGEISHRAGRLTLDQQRVAVAPCAFPDGRSCLDLVEQSASRTGVERQHSLCAVVEPLQR
ncbi:hypothetical protein CYG49_00840 [Candidatus Saccharibacteria bacterium]|nr:MAG: hypothetical protein CYG49_00840 [Candidatus Saccharibacteria bacterium]